MNCLVDDLDLCVESRYVLAMRALDVLTALVRSSLLLSLLCVCAGELTHDCELIACIVYVIIKVSDKSYSIRNLQILSTRQ